MIFGVGSCKYNNDLYKGIMILSFFEKEREGRKYHLPKSYFCDFSLRGLTCGFSNRREQVSMGNFKEIDIACTNIYGIPKH